MYWNFLNSRGPCCPPLLGLMKTRIGFVFSGGVIWNDMGPPDVESKPVEVSAQASRQLVSPFRNEPFHGVKWSTEIFRLTYPSIWSLRFRQSGNGSPFSGKRALSVQNHWTNRDRGQNVIPKFSQTTLNFDHRCTSIVYLQVKFIKQSCLEYFDTPVLPSFDTSGSEGQWFHWSPWQFSCILSTLHDSCLPPNDAS